MKFKDIFYFYIQVLIILKKIIFLANSYMMIYETILMTYLADYFF